MFGLSGKRIAWRRNQEVKPTTHLLFILLLKSTGQDGIWTRNSHGRPPHRFLYKMENCPAIPPDLSRSGYHSSLVNTVNPRPLHLQGQHRASRVVVKVKCGGGVIGDCHTAGHREPLWALLVFNMDELSEGSVALPHGEPSSGGNLNRIFLTHVRLPGLVSVYLTNLQSHLVLWQLGGCE